MRGMATLWAVLIPIVFVGTVLYVVRRIRRSSQERRQRSEERAAVLLANLGQQTLSGSRAADASVMAPAVAHAPTPVPPQPAAVSPLKRRGRILSDAQRMLFLILRAAMPEHLIMAHIRVLDLLDAPDGPDAAERDARLRALGRERLDFVVCDSDLVPVAAIVLYAAGIEQVPDESTKIEALREVGVRFLRFRADSLPRPAEVRQLVLS